MDARNQLVALALYLTAGAAMIVAGLFGFLYYQMAGTAAQTKLLQQQARQDRGALQTRLVSQKQQIAKSAVNFHSRLLLQRLEEQKRQLAEQTDLLKQKTAALTQLRRDYDQLVVSLEARSEVANPNAVAPVAVDEVATQLRGAREREAEIRRERDLLAQQLEDSTERLAALHEEADSEALALLAVAQSQQSAANRSLLQLGEIAVDSLLAALESERAEVREWSARLLGRLGGDARGALEALSVSRRDRHPRVRAAVAEAIRAIERSDP